MVLIFRGLPNVQVEFLRTRKGYLLVVCDSLSFKLSDELSYKVIHLLLQKVAFYP